MASARMLLACTIVAALAGCRAEVPRQSLKDHAASAPAAAAAPKPAHAPAAAAPEKARNEQPEDQLHAWCWDRYREHLAGGKPGSYEEKLSADSACRLIVCPTCPR